MGRASENPRNSKKRSFWKLAGQRELPNKTKVTDCRLIYTPKGGTPQEEKGLSGHFLSIGHGEFTHENRLHKTIKITFWDKDEEFKIELGIDSQLGRDVCNVILSRSDINYFDISCYESKPNDKNEVYARVGIRVNNEEKNIGWKYNVTDILKPMVTQVMFKGKLENDYTAVNNFLLEKWIAHETVLNEHAKKNPKNKEYFDGVAADAAAATDQSGRPANETQSLRDELNSMPDPRVANGEYSDPFPATGSSSDDLPF
jgi:hypothetical protein